MVAADTVCVQGINKISLPFKCIYLNSKTFDMLTKLQYSQVSFVKPKCAECADVKVNSRFK